MTITSSQILKLAVQRPEKRNFLLCKAAEFYLRENVGFYDLKKGSLLSSMLDTIPDSDRNIAKRVILSESDPLIVGKKLRDLAEKRAVELPTYIWKALKSFLRRLDPRKLLKFLESPKLALSKLLARFSFLEKTSSEFSGNLEALLGSAFLFSVALVFTAYGFVTAPAFVFKAMVVYLFGRKVGEDLYFLYSGKLNKKKDPSPLSNSDLSKVKKVIEKAPDKADVLLETMADREAMRSGMDAKVWFRVKDVIKKMSPEEWLQAIRTNGSSLLGKLSSSLATVHDFLVDHLSGPALLFFVFSCMLSASHSPVLSGSLLWSAFLALFGGFIGRELYLAFTSYDK